MNSSTRDGYMLLKDIFIPNGILRCRSTKMNPIDAIVLVMNLASMTFSTIINGSTTPLENVINVLYLHLTSGNR